MSLRRSAPFWAKKKAASGILPTDLSGLQCWYDVTDISTITKDGSNRVSQLNDKSGNSRNLTVSTGSNSPLYEATGFKGTYPSIKFDNTNSEALEASFSIGSLPLCMFGVLDLSISGGNSVFSYGVATTSNQYWYIINSFRAVSNIYRNTTTVTLAGGDNASNLDVAFYAEKTASQLRFIDKVTDSTLSETQSYMGNTLFIGRLRKVSSASYGNLRFSEMFIYSQIPSDSDKQLIFNYLSNKYGLTIPTL